jgi:hypothetical protein
LAGGRRRKVGEPGPGKERRGRSLLPQPRLVDRCQQHGGHSGEAGGGISPLQMPSMGFAVLPVRFCCNASNSERVILTRRPMRIAGRNPPSIHCLDFRVMPVVLRTHTGSGNLALAGSDNRSASRKPMPLFGGALWRPASDCARFGLGEGRAAGTSLHAAARAGCADRHICVGTAVATREMRRRSRLPKLSGAAPPNHASRAT